MGAERGCVLIVDDDEGLTAIMRLVLTRAGYEVVIAYRGQEALEWVAEHQPDRIVLDMMMPDMDGLTLLQRLRARPETRHTPIYFLTALVDEKAQAAARAAGADAYLFKPLNSAELLQLLQNPPRQ